MCGLPFSGKTTLARGLVRRLGCAYVSLDEINAERGVGRGGDRLPVEEWERTHLTALGRVEEAMGAGRDVILDDTSCFRWLRERFRAAASRRGYRTLILYLDVPAAEANRRRIENRRWRERHDVGDEVFADLAAKFEPPQADEDALVFRPGDDFASWAEEHSLGPDSRA